MEWRWTVVDDPAATDDLLAAAATADLGAAGLPAEVVAVLAPQQARARVLGHRAAYPGAVEHLLGDGDGIAGRMLVAADGQGWHLVDLVVHPRARGKGAATWMLGWLCAAADESAAAVRLSVRRDSPARALYVSHGFVLEDDSDLDLRLIRPGGHPK